MDKENLQSALKAKDPKISIVKKNDAKSSVWNKFLWPSNLCKPGCIPAEVDNESYDG